ncbi:DUF4131 domain-containing protein [bacterium]|nr:MAG: DUF4131 domain-containing protein [bacterium]
MGSSPLARPLAWGLLLYIALLTALWRAGFFAVLPPPALAAWCSVPGAVVDGRLLSGATSKRPGDRYWLLADAAAGVPVPPTKVLVYLRRGSELSETLRPGTRVRLTGRLRRPLVARDPGGFDEAGFLDSRGAALVMHAREAAHLSASPWTWRPWAAGESVHLSVHRWLAGRFTPVRASILEGLALGYRGSLPRGLDDGLERVGVVQLLTPSGDKVTALLAAVWAAALALGLRPTARGALSLAAGAAFLCVVSPEPSHLRPWLMAAGAVASRASGRGSGFFQAWLLAAWAALLWDPRQLFNPGFDLTYGALLVIIFVLPRWQAPASWPPAARLLWGLVAIEAAMHAALAPALAAFFGLLTPAALLVNPVAFPATAAAALCVWAGWLASHLPGPLARAADLPAWGADRVAQAFVWAAEHVGPQPWAAVPVAGPGPAALAVYLCGAGALLALPDRRLARRLAGGGVLAAAALGAAAAVAPPRLAVRVFDDPRRGVLARFGGGPEAPLGIGGSAALGGALFVRRPGGLVAALRGKEIYCVRSHSPSDEPLPCPKEATASTRTAGALELSTDGLEIHPRLLSGGRVHRGALPQ